MMANEICLFGGFLTDSCSLDAAIKVPAHTVVPARLSVANELLTLPYFILLPRALRQTSVGRGEGFTSPQFTPKYAPLRSSEEIEF